MTTINNTYHQNKRLRVTSSNENNFDENEYEMTSADQETNTKIPPILILDAKTLKENPKQLKDAINQDLNGIEIKQIKFTKNNNMLLYLANKQDYDQLTCEEANVQFAGKSLTILKPKLYPFVIKGINYNNAKDQKEELSEQGVVNMKEIKSARNKDAIINKVIVFCENEDTATNHKNKGYIYISYQKYRIEEYKPAIKLTSCYKCQKFGHIAKQCKSEKTICPKCGNDNHSRDENNKLICTADKKHCINCGQEHSSAYAGCEKKKRILQDMKNKQLNKQNNQQVTNVSKQVTSKLSYANAALGQGLSHINISQPIQQELSTQNKTIEDLTNRIHTLENKLAQASAENAQLKETLQKIHQIEQNQEEVNNKYCTSLIDLYHIIVQKQTYNTTTIQVLDQLIRQTGNTNINQDFIKNRLEALGKETAKTKITQTVTTNITPTPSQPSTSNQDQKSNRNRNSTGNK